MVSINSTNVSMSMDGPATIDDEQLDNIQQETMNYLSLAGMAPEEEYPVDRSRSIFELIDERKCLKVIIMFLPLLSTWHILLYSNLTNYFLYLCAQAIMSSKT